ncbi:MAG: hypothetical protein ACKPGT_00965 [Microcystis sp.]|uniref:hypothetical protein n=1 Tax=unclassified Microcystis TaxID=2643300 RepID=UPI00257B56DB|nr:MULTISPECIES: hypothetical protein [unclassified Microcystis]MCA2542235.1 hypothetical protein [Microcystis sp. M54BS1]MCA2610221.1 hypothetical protein [Microcystis sp. M27BS1]MCA6575288.1 hypothetical protein [Pseudanabaena sp. M53BS1SP1A06MG]MCA6583114.1 hypothetical protein [Pseudanabaena sp. M34BS1SP1A06MG]MCA6592731.1 hypothetical protein [Pseudanabaena sp. M38BS1SP1A06MG]MCA6602520.1 hypothetical protein [Pseudanabaena sp. M57BS1SP1A06MG]
MSHYLPHSYQRSPFPLPQTAIALLTISLKAIAHHIHKKGSHSHIPKKRSLREKD